MRWFALGVALACGLLPLTAEAANPWEELMGRKPHTWSDPQGRFSLDLPLGWKAKPHPDVPVVSFWKRHADHGAVAHVSVAMKPVPPKVAVHHFALKVLEDTKKSAYGFRLVERGRLTLSGVPAIRTHFTYQEQGNVQLVNEVDQYVLLVGERAFILTFEFAAGAGPVFQEDFGWMLKGFSARGVGQEGFRRKKRRRVRAGEMINPDAVRY